MLKVPYLTKAYFISSFISDLGEELRPTLKLFKLQTLKMAYEQAQLKS